MQSLRNIIRRVFKIKMDIFEIFAITFSTDNEKLTKKALSVMTTDQLDPLQNEMYIDIRKYVNSCSTKDGVYLREKEYNWFIETYNSPFNLPHSRYICERCPENDWSSIGTCAFHIFHWGSGRVELRQLYKGKIHSIGLNKDEAETLSKEYQSFDKIINVFESNIRNK